MTAKFFADTNVAIYAVEADEPKRQRALAVMHRSPIISTQVVNEFLNVLLVKRQLGRPSAYELARALMQGCDVIAVTAEITEQAMALGERYQIGHWDSVIIAAALVVVRHAVFRRHAGRQVFEGRLTVKNLFAGP